MGCIFGFIVKPPLDLPGNAPGIPFELMRTEYGKTHAASKGSIRIQVAEVQRALLKAWTLHVRRGKADCPPLPETCSHLPYILWRAG